MKDSILIIEGDIAKCPICGHIAEKSKEGNYDSNCKECGKDFYKNQDDVNQTTIAKYPALTFVSKVANFFAGLQIWLFGLTVLVILLEVLPYYNFAEKIVLIIPLGILTGLFWLFWKFIAEMIILFVDIAQDVRRLRNKS